MPNYYDKTRLVIDQIFSWYEGTDPSQFTPLTGENLNKTPRILAEAIDEIKKAGTGSTYTLPDEIAKLPEKVNKKADATVKLIAGPGIKITGPGDLTGDNTISATSTGGTATNPADLIADFYDNRITLIENKLYIGSQPPEYATLYVSAQLGNDSNPGTKEKPIGSLQEAARRWKDRGYTYRVYLRAGETYDWFEPVYMPSLDIYIDTYDQSIMESLPNNWSSIQPYFKPEITVEWNRPEIVVNRFFRNNGIYRRQITCNSINITGVKFILEDHDTSQPESREAPAYLQGFINTKNGSADFRGCIFNFRKISAAEHPTYLYRVDSWLRCPRVSFTSCKFLNNPKSLIRASGQFSKWLYTQDMQAQISVRVDQSVVYPNYGNSGQFPSLTNLTSFATVASDVYRQLRLGEISDSPYDISRKVMFGTLTNWDIFQYGNV